ncbi:metal-dependent hydrolase with the TIM-barrel fold-like protein [Parafrankia sp. EUN1f]|nr:amidohydrolase family protein [Parafrankia sp. EUN1f]EFC81173.1 metal-dependent hydrolase with the TIM-barrel fold-like protein [Parafrankia sp. EUN1f]
MAVNTAAGRAAPGVVPGHADVIFFGGPIVAVADTPVNAGSPEAVVKGGRIAFVGDRSRALADWRGADTQLRDLRGRALLPGFIDAHGHLAGTGFQSSVANLLAEPDGNVTTIASLRDTLAEFAVSEVGKRSEGSSVSATTTRCSPRRGIRPVTSWTWCPPTGRSSPFISRSIWARSTAVGLSFSCTTPARRTRPAG